MKTTVYCIRHGAYENPKQVLHGRLPGFPLSKAGVRMARNTARKFQRIPVAAVYSSRLTRAFETATIIAEVTKNHVVIHRNLLDIRTPLEGKPLTLARRYDGNFYQPRFIRAGGESLPVIFARMHAFLRSTVRKHAGKHVVVVTHGDLLMTMNDIYSGRSLPKTGYSFKNWYVPQATGFKIEFDGSGKPIQITKFP